MIPLEKVQSLVVKHDDLEKELSTGTIDPKTFAQKSKEYSELGNIISYAREYLKFDNDQEDLEQMLKDKNSDASRPPVPALISTIAFLLSSLSFGNKNIFSLLV